VNGEFANETYQEAVLTFSTDRYILYHLLQNYLPCFLLVIITSLFFWIEIDGGERISAIIFVLMTEMSIASAQLATLPQVGCFYKIWSILMLQIREFDQFL
jgi:hypothetical protein